MIRKLRIELDSIRPDRYYSGQSILVDFSENTKIFIIPKKNSKIRDSKCRRDTIRRFMNNPIAYLKEYFRRSNLKQDSLRTRDRQGT